MDYLVLFAGDFRKTLPVIPRSTAAGEINACLKSSFVWRFAKKLTLTTNVRVQLQNDMSAVQFTRQLMQIGNGIMPIDGNGFITFPTNFCQLMQSKEELVQSVFPDIVQQFRNYDWLIERAILAAKNIDVNVLNTTIQSRIPGELVSYKSVDTMGLPTTK